MSIKINNLRIGLDDGYEKLKRMSAEKLSIGIGDISNFRIVKESVDARRKRRIDLIYAVEFSVDGDEKLIVDGSADGDIVYQEPLPQTSIRFGSKELHHRPVIIGSGPAGLFAGLILAENGYKPIIYERGKDVRSRTESVNRFWKCGDFDPECNVQFGEGGAGTFSDGKLTTRIRDARCKTVLDTFARNGAPQEVVFSHKPHIGTDILKKVVENIRGEITSQGGEVRFSSKMTDVKVDSGTLRGITINGSSSCDCGVLILAVGHSARDTYGMLLSRGVQMTVKPFAVGFRIEHVQRMIDEAQYGRFASHPRLKAADYRLVYHSKRYDRSCYSFCMCPGGVVIAAASENGCEVTNGMSGSLRDGPNANSAIVCQVDERDFGGTNPLSGVEFQRRLEKAAYRCGGGDYAAPVQRSADFIKGTITSSPGGVRPSYTRGYNFADLNGIMPEEICAVIKEGLEYFDGKIRGFASEGIMTGVETRTSSPLRIDRNERCESVSISGLYPAGEGAGYAGGIVSAAVDGIRVAEEIMSQYAPIEK